MLRTRFAPSPTGYLHVGGLRTALYNYLLARQEQLKNGQNSAAFLLRIEDTDQTRFVEGAVESLIKTLQWMGLNSNEGPFLDSKSGKIEQKGDFGPYIQSERTELYRKHAQELIEKGAAYYCFCTSERLEEMRERQSKAKQAPMYDRTCLKLSAEQIEANKKAGMPFVIRQKIPRDQMIIFNDLIRGRVHFDGKTIDDQVLIKSDNFPTYHLANVVDDHFMQITHVIRGEEWLPSTPKHIFLYKAFGWQEPQFAHIPLLLNADKTKLSKRQGDVSVESYIEKGYCKEAIINFIALLGWHPGKGEEQEIFSLDELVEKFSLEQVHKAGAIFDIEKLNWFNFQWKNLKIDEKLYTKTKGIGGTTQKYEGKMPIKPNNNLERFVRLKEGAHIIYHLIKFTEQEQTKKFDKYHSELLLEICKKYINPAWLEQKNLLDEALIQISEKILQNPHETMENLKFYFEVKDYPVEIILNPKMKIESLEEAKENLQKAYNFLENSTDFENFLALQQTLIDFIKQQGLKNGQVLWPLRVVLTGEQFSPGTFEVMHALGKEESLKRIQKGLEKLSR